MVCLASTVKEFDVENSLRVEYWWYPGNTTFVANFLYFFKNSIIVDSLKFCFAGGGLMLQLSTKKILLKSDTERGKYASFSRLVPFSHASFHS